MSSSRKLGGDRSPVGLMPALVTLVSIAVVWIVLGHEAAFQWTFLAFALFTALAAVAWYRTRSLGYLASFLYLLSCALMLAVKGGSFPGGMARHLETRGRPRLAGGEQATRILQRLGALSAALGTTLDAGDGRLFYRPPGAGG